MIALLEQNPLLLLFLVAAVGYAVGRVKIAGFSLGVAAVLFAGLAFGALSPNLKLPEIIYLFGLVLFVYTVGLASGPSFFASLRRGGVRANLLVVGFLALGGLGVYVAHLLLNVQGPILAGLFTGAFTNTPSLAGLLETLKARGATDAVQSLPVVGYSVAYPMGVIGMLLAIFVLRRVWKVDRDAPPEPLVHRSALVTNPGGAASLGGDVRLGRVLRANQLSVATPGMTLLPGDVVSVIGRAQDVDHAIERIGVPAPTPIEASRDVLDMRRMFVSRASVAGKTVGELRLPERFGALVTRVRRGDVDLLVTDDTVLELGDRVRVVAPPSRMPELSKFFGDSLRRLSEIDIITFSVGIALGLLVGLIPIPLPGGTTFKLGFAGGPLIVGLILGALGRSGPFVWQMPQSANLTLRQLGLILFLAAVGTRAGYAFVTTVPGALGLTLLLVGALLTCGVALSFVWVAHKVFKLRFAAAVGLLAGLQTQPAVLGFAVEQTGSDEPNIAYATVYPLATITKLLLAQLLLGVML